MGMLAFTLALLYPLAGLCAPVGRWQWNGSIPGSTAASVSVSLTLTGIALLLDVIVGTPVAWTSVAFIVGLLLLPFGEETKGRPLPA